MSLGAAALNLGKTGPVQLFSSATPPNPSRQAVQRRTFQPGTLASVRTQLCLDSSVTLQYVGVWGSAIGLLTKPALFSPPDGADPFVVGSWSDRLGQSLPVQIPLDDFLGFFTTLVGSSIVDNYGFPKHPEPPDTIENNDGVSGRARLSYDANPAEPNADPPVIAALPNFLPLLPGHSFQTPVELDSLPSFQDANPLLQAWLQGLGYIRRRNANRSVTEGGDLFALPLDMLPEDPFTNITVCQHFPAAPLMLTPHTAAYAQVAEAMTSLADTTWTNLGMLQATPAAPPTGPAAAAPAMDSTAIDALAKGIGRAHASTPSKADKEHMDSAADTAAFYRLLFASAAPNPADPVLLGAIEPSFLKVLETTKANSASTKLRANVSTALILANASDHVLDASVTFEANLINQAFSTAICDGKFLPMSLRGTSEHAANTNLNLRHFLTPSHSSLSTGDEHCQPDSSKNTTLYTKGTLAVGTDVYAAVCNLRALASVLVTDIREPNKPVPMVLAKLLEYVKLLKHTDGRIFLALHKDNPNLAIHLYVGAQQILSQFVKVAKHSTLTESAKTSADISAQNYSNALVVANATINQLVAIINGTGLGEFRDVPICASWFTQRNPKTPRAITPAGSPGTPNLSPEPKRPRRLDQAEIDKRKANGIIEWTPAGPRDRLPHCPIMVRGERLCMKFLTKGFYCDRAICPFPHISGIQKLPERDRPQYCTWIDNTRSLGHVPGKGPAGTPPPRRN